MSEQPPLKTLIGDTCAACGATTVLCDPVLTIFGMRVEFSFRVLERSKGWGHERDAACARVIGRMVRHHMESPTVRTCLLTASGSGHGR